MQLKPVMDELAQRIDAPDRHAVDRRLTRRILDERRQTDPLRVKAEAFNLSAEAYYRQELRQHHIQEAFVHFRKAVKVLDSWPAWRSGQYNQALLAILGGKNSGDYLAEAERAMAQEALSAETCEKLIALMLLVFHQSKNAAGN